MEKKPPNLELDIEVLETAETLESPMDSGESGISRRNGASFFQSPKS